MHPGRPSHRRWLPALGVSIVLALATPTNVPEVESSETGVDRSWGIADEAHLVERIANVSAERALLVVEEELALGPRGCTPYRLAVEAARKAGSVERLANVWEERLRRGDEDPFLLVGYAAALRELGAHVRSRNLLSRAARRHTPCAEVYEELVRSSQAAGSLAAAENVLVSQATSPAGKSVWALYGRGLVHEARGDNGPALRAYENAVQRVQPPSAIYFRGSVLLEGAGEFSRALDWAEKGAEVAERRGPLAVLPRILSQQSKLHYRLGRVSESEQIFRRAIELTGGEPALRATLLLRRAYLLLVHGRHDQAAKLIERAQQIDVSAERIDLVARVAHELGRSHVARSNLDAARESFERSLELAGKRDDVFGVWDAELELAQIDLIDGRAARALEAMAPLLEQSLVLSDGQRQTVALQTAATVYERLGSFERSLELFTLALRGSEIQRDLSLKALTLGNIAIVEMRLGLEASALGHADEAARLAPLTRDPTLNTGLLQSLGAALAGTGRLDEARRVYEQALTTADPRVTPELSGLLYAGLGRVLLALDETETAGARFRDALAIGTGASRLVRLQALSGLALTEWRRGDLHEALELFESSLELVEASRSRISTERDRVRYQETRFTIYANLGGVLTELDERYPNSGYASRAFGVIERSRARALLDVLDERTPSLPAEWIPQSAPTSGARMLRDSELVLEYALGDERSTLWVISRRELHRIALPPRARIQEEVMRFLKTLRSPPRAPTNPIDAHQRAAASVYRMLIEPAAPHLEGTEHLIVAPHGILHNLPFEALAAHDRDGELRYLIEDHTVTYIPSLSVWAGLRRRGPRLPHRGLDFVGFAQSKPVLAPSVRHPALLPIPFADDEIEAAGRSFAQGSQELFQGERATEARLKRELAASHRIVHIAAHALADTARPDRSAIFVGASGPGREDGILSMREVSSLSIGANVVVLSGCETGLGQVMEVEGTLGFTWAFLSAGASTVAVTLWNVNDRATADVVETFYDEVGRGSSLGEALAHAKRRMLRSTRRAYRHPYFWAPMIVVGLDRSIESRPEAR